MKMQNLQKNDLFLKKYFRFPGSFPTIFLMNIQGIGETKNQLSLTSMPVNNSKYNRYHAQRGRYGQVESVNEIPSGIQTRSSLFFMSNIFFTCEISCNLTKEKLNILAWKNVFFTRSVRSEGVKEIICRVVWNMSQIRKQPVIVLPPRTNS